MVNIRGYSAHLSDADRQDITELVSFINQFKGKAVFIYRRQEVKLHAIRYSATTKEVQFLLKETK